MGANHIMDIHRYPDQAPSESLILSKITHEAKEMESSEAFKRAQNTLLAGDSAVNLA
jgi:hypothetical protein